MGIRQLEVELDAKVIVGLLKSNFTPNFAYAPLLSDCKYLLGKLPQVAKDNNGLYYARLVVAGMAAVIV